MSALRAWLGRSEAAPPPAEPLDFDRPPPPGACLAAPAGADITTHPYPTPPAALFEALSRLVEGEPRTTRRALPGPGLRAQWVQRTARAGFPDLIHAEVRAMGQGAALFLCSQGWVGFGGRGRQRARLERWLAALDAMALPSPPPPSAPAAPALAPSALAIALARRAAGRHVLVAGDDAPEAPLLLLHAASHGALNPRILSAVRPTMADAGLLAAGRALGLEALAQGLLARARVGASADATPRGAPCWWLREGWEAPDLAERLGRLDLVVQAADLATCADPSHRLLQLRRSGARGLLLRCLVPAEGAAAGFTRDSLWHAAALTVARAAALHAHLAEAGLDLPQLRLRPGGLPPEAALAAGLEQPLHWFMGEAALRRLLADAGWAPATAERQGPRLLLTATAA